MLFHLGLVVFILMLYFLICSKKTAKRGKIFLAISFFTFFILVASREMTMGNDTQNYLELFKYCATQKWSAVQFGTHYEFGYLIFNVLIGYITTSPRIFLIIMSAIINFSLYYFIKKYSKNYLLSVLMYVCLLSFYASMSELRQFLALSIIIFGIDFAKQKRLLPFVFVILIATTIHSSAPLAFLIYPIMNLKFTRKRATLFILAGFLASLSIEIVYTFFTQIIGREAYYSARATDISLANLLYSIVFGIFYLFARYIISAKKKTETENDFYLYSLLFAFIVYLLGVRMNVMSRLGTYFNILSLISLPNILLYLDAGFSRKAINLAMVSFLILYSSTIIALRPEWNSAYHYKTCLLPEEDFICERSIND